MPTVSLAQALKIKNRLAGEVSRLRAIITRENSRKETTPERVDVDRVLEEMIEKSRKLAEVKGTIATANAGATNVNAGIYGIGMVGSPMVGVNFVGMAFVPSAPERF